MNRGATLSADGVYRYRLARTWDDGVPPLAWLMLNPSTADASNDDPTIRRCIGFARGFGYGGIVVVNLFAARATDPTEIGSFIDPVGPDNDATLLDVCRQHTTVAAWGASVPHYWRHRPRAVVSRMRAAGVALYALGFTKAGHPRHPLYVRGDAALTRWES